MSVRDAITHAIQDNPSELKNSIYSALDAKVSDALELKKISTASEYFNMPEEEYEEEEMAEQDVDLDERVRALDKAKRRETVDYLRPQEPTSDGRRRLAAPSTGGKDRIGKGGTINQAGRPQGDEKGSRQKKKPLARPARYGRRDDRRDSAGKDVGAERVSSGVTKADVPELKRNLRKKRMQQNKNPDKGSVWNGKK